MLWWCKFSTNPKTCRERIKIVCYYAELLSFESEIENKLLEVRTFFHSTSWDLIINKIKNCKMVMVSKSDRPASSTISISRLRFDFTIIIHKIWPIMLFFLYMRAIIVLACFCFRWYVGAHKAPYVCLFVLVVTSYINIRLYILF